MKLKEDEVVKPFKHSRVFRPWGYFSLYAENELCTTKILYIKPKESLSLQYHFRRCQLYLPLDDNFLVQYSDKPVPINILNMIDDNIKFDALNKFLEKNLITMKANSGDLFGFHKYVVHRTTYLGEKEYGRILDIAYPLENSDENDELDIVRIKDNYGRSNF